MRKTMIVLAVTALTTTGALAQQRSGQPPPPPPKTTTTTPAASPLTAASKAAYENYKGDLVKSAEQMKDTDYGFKPVGVAAEVRTFGQIIGHVADANAAFCSAASGQPGPATVKDLEHAKTKADIQKGLADSFAFCDTAWAATTDANAAKAAKMPFDMGDSTRLAVLAFNTAHMSEHYGNIVTYMRAKGLVPPSSQPKK
jgi:uncharacterized damage-inducible protein DinB